MPPAPLIQRLPFLRQPTRPFPLERQTRQPPQRGVPSITGHHQIRRHLRAIGQHHPHHAPPLPIGAQPSALQPIGVRQRPPFHPSGPRQPPHRLSLQHPHPVQPLQLGPQMGQ